MPSTLLYFGAQPNAGQFVTDELKAAGLDLLKINPQQYRIDVEPRIPNPLHEIYLNNLPMFIYSAYEKTRVGTSTHKFPGFPLSFEAPTTYLKPFPTLIFSFNDTLDPGVANGLKTGYGAREVRVQNKTSYVIEEFSLDNLAAIKAMNPITTTKATEGTLNISAFQYAIVSWRLITALLSTNQYASFSNGTITAAKAWQQMEVALSELKDVSDRDGNVSMTSKAVTTSTTFSTTTNLAQPPESYQFWITTPNDVPADHDLVFFPYRLDLAKEDTKTVPTFIRQYLCGLLSDDREVALEAAADIQGAWGIIGHTTWGKMMTHVVKVLEVALRAQCFTVVLCPDPSDYKGSFLCGSNYIISDQLKGTVTSSPRQAVIDHVIDLDPHYRSLKEITAILVGKLGHPEQGLRDNISSSGKFARWLSGLTISENDKSTIRSACRALSFTDGYQKVTPTTIHDAISDIHNNSPISGEIPVHPLAFLTDDMTLVHLSRFGRKAPSFRVDGGKKMNLGEQFVVQTISGKGGQKGTRNVGKIAAVMKTLETSVADMKLLVADKCVLNPYGNIGIRNATTALVKTYEGDDCLMVVSALRLLAQVNVTPGGGATGNKRKANNDGENSGKRARTLFNF